MNLRSRKLVAVFMLLWLPLFASSALAAAVPMQLHGGCIGKGMHAVQKQGISTHHAVPMHKHGPSCNDCGVCHVTCGSYLATQTTDIVALQQDGQAITPLTISFTSITSAPLDPPPLARA